MIALISTVWARYSPETHGTGQVRTIAVVSVIANDRPGNWQVATSHPNLEDSSSEGMRDKFHQAEGKRIAGGGHETKVLCSLGKNHCVGSVKFWISDPPGEKYKGRELNTGHREWRLED